MADAQKIEIGFEGGPVIALRVGDKALKEIRGKLGEGGWHRLATEDGEVDIDLARVVFVKTAVNSTKVGF